MIVMRGLGTNWVAEIAFKILRAAGKTEQTVDSVEFGPMEMKRPTATQPGYVTIADIPSPRLVVKVLVPMRNPKDTAVSTFHFLKKLMPLKGGDPDSVRWEEFAEDFSSGTVPFGDYCDWLTGWWQLRDDPHFLFLKYEDMKKDLLSAVKAIVAFLEVDLDESTIKGIAEASTFNNMKADMDNSKMAERRNIARKGIIGDWKNTFSSKESDLFDSWYEKKLGGANPYCPVARNVVRNVLGAIIDCLLLERVSQTVQNMSSQEPQSIELQVIRTSNTDGGLTAAEDSSGDNRQHQQAVTVTGSVIIFTSSPVSNNGQHQQETTTFPETHMTAPTARTTVEENNDIYVADSGNRRVQVHDMSGTHLHLFPTVVPRTHGKKMMPYDVAIDGDNMIWVLGKTRSFGEYLIQYTTGGHPMLKLLVGFHTNLGIAINYQRKLIIVTEILEGSGQVKILRPDGSLVTRFGEQQKMVNPGSVTVNSEGNIFVSDYGTDHVYSFNGQGNFLFKFNANMPAELHGICTDISDHIVVTGTGNIAAIIFTSSGRYLRHIASTNRRYEGDKFRYKSERKMLGRAFTKIWRHKDSENHYYLDLEGFKSKGPTQEDNVAYCPAQDASSTEDSNDSNDYEHPEEVSFGYKARDVNECTKKPCQHDRCVNKDGGYSCVCSPGWTGQNCQQDINECTRNPCQHGRCVNKDGGYKCICSPGWTGQNCQEDVNECTKKPCQHGRCVNKDGGYKCICSPGWTEQNCQQDINECTRNPCQHGRCVNKDGGYKCTCSPGWTGQNCQQDINECVKTPCQHGRCVNKDGGYKCTCSPGWAGQNCQQDINECTRNPCQHGRCVNKDGGYKCTCSPGWTGQNCQQDINNVSRPHVNMDYCVNKDGGYTCTCSPGWTGQNCQQDINECTRNPCQRGRCVNKDGGYKCTCSPGWTGQNCQQDIKCAKTPCRHGRCVNKDGGYTCVCLPGWTGQNCQQNINECTRKPCGHGRCVNKDGGYKCTCSPGWTGQNCQQAECPSGWSGHGDHCYKLMKVMVDWTVAKSKCERVGAELASVKDEKENDFIADLVVGAPKGKVAFVWLGLSKERGVWQWTDGSLATYTNWAPKEPNNSFWHAAFRGENCGGRAETKIESERKMDVHDHYYLDHEEFRSKGLNKEDHAAPCLGQDKSSTEDSSKPTDTDDYEHPEDVTDDYEHPEDVTGDYERPEDVTGDYELPEEVSFGYKAREFARHMWNVRIFSAAYRPLACGVLVIIFIITIGVTQVKPDQKKNEDGVLIGANLKMSGTSTAWLTTSAQDYSSTINRVTGLSAPSSGLPAIESVTKTGVNKETGILTTVAHLSATAECQSGWSGHGNHCYKLMKDKVCWIIAKSRCERLGAELTSVKDKEENDFIAGLVVGGE
uniref:Uncharacterized protein n=1 Tax=Branchiostoma floridae TaxID=7739 RepID=C3Y3F0_BRAFL|eukprot:XP_002609207.1 hypothetical protein BRAFLDRAFT_125961 [Branchiostoma floridae]